MKNKIIRIFNAILLFLLIITSCIGFVYLFLVFVKAEYPNFYSQLSNSGPIGDVLGGLTAPIINLASIILIYYSFREQFQANEIQRNALQDEIKRSNTLKELQQILDLLADVKSEIAKLEIKISREETIYGEDSIEEMSSLTKESDYQKYVTDLSKIIELLHFICQKTTSYDFEIRDERVIFEKIYLIFPEDFQNGIEKILKPPIPFPQNERIELRIAAIDIHLRRIQKFQSTFLNKDIKAIGEEGEIRTNKIKENNIKYKQGRRRKAALIGFFFIVFMFSGLGYCLYLFYNYMF